MLRNKLTQTLNTCSKLQNRLIHISPIHFEDMKMEKSLNQVTLLGRVGNEPQKRGTEQHPVVTFSLATHSNYRYDSGDLLQRTDWHRISIFRPQLRDLVSSFLKKGQRVFVTGRLTYGEVKSEDGQVRTTSTVIADDVIFFQRNSSTDD